MKKSKTIRVVNPVKSMKLNAKKKTLKVKKTFKLKAVIAPKNATNKKVTYKSRNKKIVIKKSPYVDFGYIPCLLKGNHIIHTTSAFFNICQF